MRQSHHFQPKTFDANAVVVVVVVVVVAVVVAVGVSLSLQEMRQKDYLNFCGNKKVLQYWFTVATAGTDLKS